MPISPENIVEARRLLKPIIHQTPIIPDEKLGNKLGAKVFLKAECMQRGGSFKVRGAFTKISSLTEAERQKGVITASAGNHAQGVALAAKLLGVQATIVLPDYAPLTKIAATKALGAEVILKGDSFDAAVAYSRELEEQLGLTYVHAFDDELIITGQASIGCEINEEIPGLTKIVVPIGGGGLASGVALAAKFFNKSVKVYGVQAENVTSINPSLVAGEPLEAKARPTIADGIAVKRPGKLTLPIIRDNVEKVLEVSEEEIAAGVYHCVQNAHLVAEGAGAASVAALLAGKIPINDNDIICAIIAGGNIDGNLLSRILEQVLVRQGRYVIFKMLVLDRPGSLAAMLERVAEAGANVMEINHQRAIWLAPLGYTGIEMILEVRDEQHAKLVHKHLEDCGYHLVREGQGDWN